ncbi:MAG TPA: DUF2079 domain-containing protein [Nannocystis sp.]
MSSEARSLRPAGWLWLAAMAVGPGLALWAVRQADPAAVVMRDEAQGRGGAALWAGGSAALLAVVLAVWSRRAGVIEALSGLVARGRWLALLPLWPLLRFEPAGVGGALAPMLVVVLGGVVAWSVYGFANMSQGTWRGGQALLASPRACALALAAAGAAVLVRLSELALLRHHALISRVFDLGIYDNLMWNTMHGRLLACGFVRGGSHVTAHVDPLLILLTPIYALSPGPEVLLVVQAAAVLSGAAPVYLLALRRLGRPWLALVLGLGYLLHPSVHGTILFDVHSLAFAAPLCLWALYFLECGATRRYALMIALLLLTREDVALLVCGLGLYAALGGGRRRLGLVTVAAAVVYFVTVKWFVQFTPYQYARRYAAFLPEEGGGFAAVAASVLSNPAHAVYEALALRKLVFVLVLLAPLLLLPVLAGSLWWTFAFGLAFTLLASNTMNYFALSHHTVMLFPVFFAAAPAGIDRAAEFFERFGGDRGRAVRALGVGVLVASLLATQRMGALIKNGSFAGWPHAVPYALDEAMLARLQWVRAVEVGLPREASLAVSNSVGAHFSARDNVYFYPEVKDADYLVLARLDVHPKGGAMNVRGLERRGYTLIDRHEDEIFVLRRTGQAP